MSESEQHELGDLSDLEEGDRRFYDVGDDYGVVVCRVKGELYALEDNCSHADTPLSEGRLRGYQITCPLHGTSFDVRDGTHSGPPAYTGVGCYAVTESETGVVIQRVADDSDEPDEGFGSAGGIIQTR